MRRLFLVPLALVLLLAGCAARREVPAAPTDLFVSGQGGYKTYRIPSVIRTNDGVLLAFCEGRKNGASDTGDIDLLLRRSTDGGRTWGPTQVVWDDGVNTCGNPCPVVDRSTGTVWLLLTWNRGDDREREIIDGKSRDTRRAYVARSDDAGLTWSRPVEITAQVKLADWTWYATGPGAGIQLERGPRAGRLVVPCDHIGAADKRSYSHVIVSDDHGATWQLAGSTPAGVNECEVAELADGRLLLNMRNSEPGQHRRQVARSDDAGATWRDLRPDSALPEPHCQASLRRLRWPAGEQPGVLLFVNPASEKGRVNLTVRASLDDGASWPLAKVVDPAGAAYSCMVALDAARGEFGCLYEGERYSRITWVPLNLRELAPVKGE